MESIEDKLFELGLRLRGYNQVFNEIIFLKGNLCPVKVNARFLVKMVVVSIKKRRHGDKIISETW